MLSKKGYARIVAKKLQESECKRTKWKNMNVQHRTENPELKLANDFVRYTGNHIFLTGKAGTGKTTFLQNLKGNMAKRMIVTAPTGVAAINAGGVTLHSFFQLPFGPFLPGSEAYDSSRQRMFRFSRKKKQIIKSLDLLVIDEISMVRADLLDSVDAVLRRHRRNELPFGGVQLLMIGDLHQLPPVAKKEEWALLHQYYPSVYFFSSHALAGSEMVTIELKQIYRQSDPRFIGLLNRVRENRMNARVIRELNKRHIENYSPENDRDCITLTTHNHLAESINKTRLAALPQKEYAFAPDVSGVFPEHAHPIPGALELKKGAQVMFLRNDTAEEKRYYNGKIGRVRSISGDEIRVACPDRSEDIVVEPVVWENITYSMNEENHEIEEDIIGKFTQYPLKLAWAITIHKSQGLTFDRAVIDAKSAFANGQVYVALSRCRTLEGMVLSSPIPARSIAADEAVSSFVEAARQHPPSEERLRVSKIHYQQQLLLECFDFSVLGNRLGYFGRLLSGNKSVVQVSGVSDMGRLQQMAHEHIFTVGDKFKRQLETIFQKEALPESDAHTLDRIHRASGWFEEKFSFVFNDLVENLQVETDNKKLSKKIGNALTNLKQEIVMKHAGVVSCKNGFSPSRYLKALTKAEMDFSSIKAKKQKVPDYDESDIEHPELFQQLRDWRSRMARELDVAHFHILHQRVLVQIVVTLPDSPDVLKKIKGVGKKTIEKYGRQILGMVTAYRNKHGIEEVELPIPKTMPDKKTQEKRVSRRAF